MNYRSTERMGKSSGGMTYILFKSSETRLCVSYLRLVCRGMFICFTDEEALRQFC